MGEFAEQAQKICLFWGILELPNPWKFTTTWLGNNFLTCSPEKSRVPPLLRPWSQNGPYKALIETLSCDSSNFQTLVTGPKGCVLELLTALPVANSIGHQHWNGVFLLKTSSLPAISTVLWKKSLASAWSWSSVRSSEKWHDYWGISFKSWARGLLHPRIFVFFRNRPHFARLDLGDYFELETKQDSF